MIKTAKGARLQLCNEKGEPVSTGRFFNRTVEPSYRHSQNSIYLGGKKTDVMLGEVYFQRWDWEPGSIQYILPILPENIQNMNRLVDGITKEYGFKHPFMSKILLYLFTEVHDEEMASDVARVIGENLNEGKINKESYQRDCWLKVYLVEEVLSLIEATPQASELYKNNKELLLSNLIALFKNEKLTLRSNKVQHNLSHFEVLAAEIVSRKDMPRIIDIIFNADGISKSKCALSVLNKNIDALKVLFNKENESLLKTILDRNYIKDILPGDFLSNIAKDTKLFIELSKTPLFQEILELEPFEADETLKILAECLKAFDPKMKKYTSIFDQLRSKLVLKDAMRAFRRIIYHPDLLELATQHASIFKLILELTPKDGVVDVFNKLSYRRSTLLSELLSRDGVDPVLQNLIFSHKKAFIGMLLSEGPMEILAKLKVSNESSRNELLNHLEKFLWVRKLQYVVLRLDNLTSQTLIEKVPLNKLEAFVEVFIPQFGSSLINKILNTHPKALVGIALQEDPSITLQALQNADGEEKAMLDMLANQADL